MNQTNTLEETIENSLEILDETGESKIASMLDSYGIPFFYKEPTIVYDKGDNKLIYPVFTLPSYGGTIIDYMQESYGDKYKYKQELYQQNQMPAAIITPQELKSSTWQQQLYQKLNDTYSQMQSSQQANCYHQPSGYIQPG